MSLESPSHTVHCAVLLPFECHHSMTSFIANLEDAIRSFRWSGWEMREDQWLCPVCLVAYDARRKLLQ